MRLHLDSDYSRHFLLFALRDGRVLSSRDVNWREVPLHDIDALTISIRGHEFTITRAEHATFVEFVHFRTEAIVHKLVDGAWIAEMQREWVIGFTDGAREYCWIFDFATGLLKERREYERNRALFESHFHPQAKSGGILIVSH